MKIKLIYSRLLWTCLFLELGLVCGAQNMNALLVGLSRYQSYEWQEIHGKNDVELLEVDLKKQNFAYIQTLKDEEATFDNIISGLKQFIDVVQKGDVAYFHFSGHGQPVLDLNGDEGEQDGWDESIVPYDAAMTYDPEIYAGEYHLLDDYLNQYFSSIREKLGDTGILYVVIDACYSGTGSRDMSSDDLFYRGVDFGFDFGRQIQYEPKVVRKSFYSLEEQEGLSDVVVLEACRPYQRNMEIKVEDSFYGPLSYYIHRALQETEISVNPQWVSKVVSLFKQDSRLKNQNIVCETNLNNDTKI